MALGPLYRAARKVSTSSQANAKPMTRAAQADDVHVVVFHTLPGGKGVHDRRRPHAADLVGGHGSPDSAAADGDPALDLSGGNGPGQWQDVVRVVVAGIVIGRAKSTTSCPALRRASASGCFSESPAWSAAMAMRIASPQYLRNVVELDKLRSLYAARQCGDTLYSTVTLLARFRGLSTSQPRATAM